VARPEGQVLQSRITTSQNVREEFSARHYGLHHLRLPSDHFANHDPLLLNLFFPRHVAARVSHHVPIAIQEGLGRFVTKKAEIAVGVIVLRGKFPGLDRSAPRVPNRGMRLLDLLAHLVQVHDVISGWFVNRYEFGLLM